MLHKKGVFSSITYMFFEQNIILGAFIHRPLITSQAFFSVNMNALHEHWTVLI